MKILVSLLVFAVYSNIVSGQSLNKQSTYLDAVELARIYVEDRNTTYHDNATYKKAFEQILEKYGISRDNIDSNPFLAGYVIEHETSAAITAVNKPYVAPDTAPGIANGGDWQSLVINTLASFMAERFKDEAMHMAIDRLFSKISADDKVTVKLLFPKSFVEIEKLYNKGNGNYYTADLLYIRELVKSDLDQLPEKIGTNPTLIFTRLGNHKQFADILTISYLTLKFSKESRDLPSIITLLSEKKYQSADLKKALQLADMIAFGMRDVQGRGDLWINPGKLDPADIGNLNPMVRFFYGLIYQQMQDAASKLSLSTLSGYLNVADTRQLAQKIAEMISFVNKCNEAYSYLKGKDFTIKTTEDALLQVRSTLGIFKSVLINPSYGQIFHIDAKAMEVFENVIEVNELFMKKDYQRALPVLLSYWSPYLPDGLNAGYNRSVAFLSQFATVTTHEDMTNMFNSYALPIGSSSIKRFSSFNVSLNGYVGFNGGWETAYGTLGKQTKKNFGLTAPVGVSLTFGGAFTALVSVIDLGSIVNVRLKNDTTYYSDLKLEQFFAPGIGAFYNFKRLPLSIGIQYSYIPNLRSIKYEIDKTVVSESNRSVSRVNFSVLFDIPFLTLYHNKRN